MQSRHGRELRADNDPRRRPADGFRTRDVRRFLQLVEDALGDLPEELVRLADEAELLVEGAPPPTDPPVLARYTRGDGAACLVLYRRALEARAGTRAELVQAIREAAGQELAAALGLDFDELDERD